MDCERLHDLLYLMGYLILLLLVRLQQFLLLLVTCCSSTSAVPSIPTPGTPDAVGIDIIHCAVIQLATVVYCKLQFEVPLL